MKFSDIVALAKAGYKPADVKELLELCETDPKTKETEPPPEPKKDPAAGDEKDVLDAFEKLVKESEE